jgi:hypothetical protein
MSLIDGSYSYYAIREEAKKEIGRREICVEIVYNRNDTESRACRSKLATNL